MNFKFARLFMFLLANGEDITNKLNELLAFVNDLRERYGNGEVSIASAVDLETVKASHTELAAACAEFDSLEPSIAADGPEVQGVFGDFVKFVISNPDKVIKFIEVFKKLFG